MNEVGAGFVAEKMVQWWVVPGPDGGVLERRLVDLPRPGESQAVVIVRAAGLNRGELFSRGPLRTGRPGARGYPSGVEFAGEIVALGPGLNGWSVGDRVMGRAPASHAEYVVVPVDALIPVPAALTSTEAAAVPNVFVTAHDALVTTARIGPADRVLITAGSSGVGSAALQIARYVGCRTVAATTRSTAKADRLRVLGATAVIDTSEPGWAAEAVVEADTDTGGAFDVVIDQVGGALFPALLEVLAISGRYVTVGRNDGTTSTIDLDVVARKRLELIGVTFRTRTAAEALACSKRFADQLLPAFETGQLAPVLDRTFPLEALDAAFDYLASDAQVGKVVVTTSCVNEVDPSSGAGLAT
ncbi:MAG: zinc-binding dehydrogenase [Acidimicrobiia bacterium]|nr:zinc-binding dehydrogenase [Acidimicrobiia bacterium]